MAAAASLPHAKRTRLYGPGLAYHAGAPPGRGTEMTLTLPNRDRVRLRVCAEPAPGASPGSHQEALCWDAIFRTLIRRRNLSREQCSNIAARHFGKGEPEEVVLLRSAAQQLGDVRAHATRVAVRETVAQLAGRFGRVHRRQLRISRASWNMLHGILTLEDLPGGVALPGARRRRRAAYVVVNAASGQQDATVRVRAPGLDDTLAAPGRTLHEQRRDIIHNPLFLRGLLARLLMTAAWPALPGGLPCAAAVGVPELVLCFLILVDGIRWGGGLT
eukprot:gene4024-7940_t